VKGLLLRTNGQLIVHCTTRTKIYYLLILSFSPFLPCSLTHPLCLIFLSLFTISDTRALFLVAQIMLISLIHDFLSCFCSRTHLSLSFNFMLSSSSRCYIPFSAFSALLLCVIYISWIISGHLHSTYCRSLYYWTAHVHTQALSYSP